MGTTMLVGQGTVRFGDLEPFRSIIKQLKDSNAKYSVLKTCGGQSRKVFLDGVEIVSVAQWGRMWIYRYNKEYFGS